jgi:predicted nucleotidyltransferase
MRKADFEAIARALNDAGVPFIIVGGIAVVEHGYGRNTVDVDMVIRLDRQSVLKAFEALGKLGYRPRVPISAEAFADPVARQQLIEEKKMQVLNFWSDSHRDTPLDIFVREPFDFVREYEQAQIREPSPGLPVRIVQLRTLFEMKKAAGRLKDLADIDELNLLYGLPSSYDKEK